MPYTGLYCNKPPVLCAPPRKDGRAGSDWENALARSGWDLWNPTDSLDDFTGSVFREPGRILAAHSENSPGRSLLLVHENLEISTALAAELHHLVDKSSLPAVYSLLSNSYPELNPLTDTDLPDTVSEMLAENDALAALVSLLGPGELHPAPIWPGHLLLFNAAAVELLGRPGISSITALTELRDLGGELWIPDTLYLRDSTKPINASVELQPHETARAPGWGMLNARLHKWLSVERPAIEIGQAGTVNLNGTSTLHITHSWGGGVARWVDSFITADNDNNNFQLRSEGPQRGRGTGQRLSLYHGNFLEQPIASWWLQAPIESVATTHAQYSQILQEIIDRYAIGRLIVSSLVGHSLDSLRTDVPTIQILHDFFPVWPLLGVHPGPYLAENESADLAAALEECRTDLLFSDRDASSWVRVADEWRQILDKNEIPVIAPSRSVVDMMHKLSRGWQNLLINVIPHGLPPFSDCPEIIPSDREDGRLRIVIPGRIQPGKGQALLLEALPQLTQHARLCLLGTGQSGEAFFGKSGVDVIIQYERDELPRLLAHLAPHAAALLSIVPETFSYTLSEMQHLHVPVIATRVGSLEERVIDGETGWLIQPGAEALVGLVKNLQASPGKIARVREQLAAMEQSDTRDMVHQYDTLCRPARPEASFEHRTRSLSDEAGALAFERAALEQHTAMQTRQLDALQTEVEQRTDWAEARDRALKEEQEEKVRWVTSLEAQLDERFEELTAARKALDLSETALSVTTSHLKSLREQHEAVLASSSWRMTRPLRVGRRMLANIGRSRAWNPLRWPLLLSRTVRTISTLGWKESLLRFQEGQDYQPQKLVTDVISGPGADSVGDPAPPEALPRHDAPKVSIIIPVFNQWVYSAACLRSLVAAKNDASWEIIMVDDCSEDDTADYMSEIPGLIAIRNETNQGFIHSCNAGAKQARGEFLVFLNNDTQVLDDWLDQLLSTFDRFPDTGLAGARLIYPDGRLQEAGGMIFSDGSGWNYGRLDVADKPEYQFVREVDYCSGACIMVRTATFSDLDGFDRRYAPAYYEDTDLAFRIRELGQKVRVNPLATVIHHEGISSGTDISSGVKQFQQANKDKFHQRWADQLLRQPPPITEPENKVVIRNARDHRFKGHILVIDAYTPEPDQDSGSLRLVYMLDCLVELGYKITFLPDNRAFAGKYTRNLQQAGIEVVCGDWVPSLHRFFSERGHEFGTIFISRHYVAVNYLSLMRRFCPTAKFVFDTVDLHYLREQRLAELEENLPLERAAAQTRRSELSVIESADVTLVVSTVEKSVLEQDAPKAEVRILSNIHKPMERQKDFADRKDIFFVGGYQHPPNIDAAIWFVNHIWPLVRQELPDIKFHLIGSKAPQKIMDLGGNGVIFHGFVPDLAPWLDDCKLAVAPLRYGAGVKGKVNLSMSRGQPVVATPPAIEGIFGRPGEDIMVANDAEQFAEAVVSLYQDEQLWNRISDGGLENVRLYFSLETARGNLRELLRGLNRSRS